VSIRRLVITSALVAIARLAPAQEACPPYRAGQLEHWGRDAVFYQVFVRSFFDSNGDGIGDFKGLTSKLDYINDGNPATESDLGVTALWLMPITQSPSYHGYDTTDYDHIEQDYGMDEDFAAFTKEAHRRGLRVVMDLVLNHCSSKHPWFVEASSSATSPHHDWFVWRKDDPHWPQPWSSNPTWHYVPSLGLFYYGLFWDGMPDLNYENPAVRHEMTETALRWLRKGVDGFRLDAARHMIEAGSREKMAGSPETHAWWREFGAALRKEFPEVLLVGENWTNVAEVSEYYGTKPGEELDASFDFDLSGAFIQALSAGSALPIEDALCQVARSDPPHALDATFLTNHDMIRVMTQLRGDRDKARLGAALLLTLPGVPFVYYGEELGMTNGPGGADEEKRTPMQWTPEGGFTTGTPWRHYQDNVGSVNVQSEEADAGSLLHEYRRLVRLRLAHAALAHGGFEPLKATGPAADTVLAFERSDKTERLLVLANLGENAVATVQLEPGPGPVSKALYPAGAPATIGPLAPRSLVVLELK
jgi:alpha-amylase